MEIGFIGAGNMATAIASGIIKNNIIKKEEIIISDASSTACEKIKNNLGVNVARENTEVAKQAKIIVLSVKPQHYQAVINEIKEYVDEEKIIITIAPGQTLEKLEMLFGKSLKIVRTMPNTPALVGEGITGVCCNENVSDKDLERVCDILNGFGLCEVVSESMMDAVVSISGSSPAYVFMFIEAMADAGVRDGLPRDKAYKFAAQAVLGSAKMVLETGKHPAELKDMVCSPAGTTIEAVRVLEEKGLRSSVMEAMKACTDKARSL